MKVNAYMPQLAAVLGIRPWEIKLLRLDEFDVLCDWLDNLRGGDDG